MPGSWRHAWRVDPLSLPRSLASSLSGAIGDLLRSPTTAEAVSQVEDKLTQRRHESKVEEGTLRGVHIAVYRGWISHGVARIRFRLVEAAELPGDSWIPYYDVVSTNLRRHATLPFPDVTATVEIAGVSEKVTTDRHGFGSAKIEVGDLPSGWHDVKVTVPHHDPKDGDYVKAGRALRPPDDARIAIISDIDDTVLRTGLDEGFTALRRTLFGEAGSRRAVPGMSSLYRGISRGVTGHGEPKPGRPGVFYVSTGSWAFYEMLVQFLQLRGFPRGPLFLTDWGPSDRYIHRSGREHKEGAIQRIAEGYPHTPLVLIGDSGQNDPAIYTEFAAENPGRVKLILIIGAGSKSEDKTETWRSKSQTLRDEGVPLYVVDDALEAARLCVDLEMCDDLTVEEVETEMGAIF